MIVTYWVDVGDGAAQGSVHVPDEATEDEINTAILNDLYDYGYTTEGD